MHIEYLLFGIALGSMIAWARAHGRAEYYRGRHQEQDDSGWAEEARFWRRVYNKEAAESVEPTVDA